MICDRIPSYFKCQSQRAIASTYPTRFDFTIEFSLHQSNSTEPVAHLGVPPTNLGGAGGVLDGSGL